MTTHINTQQESLHDVFRLARGELSLGAAISSLDWVSSHEKYGRNR